MADDRFKKMRKDAEKRGERDHRSAAKLREVMKKEGKERARSRHES